jgi:diphthamide synthase (EF-2-diphthine--ammonia ligase)
MGTRPIAPAPDIELVGLLTTLNTEFQRVAMHGTRRSILEAQAAAANLPLWIVPLPWPCSNEIYEQKMTEVCNRAVSEHVDVMAFGDLFLPDIRAYRETQMKPTGLEPLFPLWELPTAALARDMIAGGLRAKLACEVGKDTHAPLFYLHLEPDGCFVAAGV